MNSFGFQSFIGIMIIISCIILAVDNPLLEAEANELLVYTLFAIDAVITLFFVFEMLLKFIEKGIIFCGPKSYFRSIWNILDFIIIAASVMPIFLNVNEFLSVLKILRILKILRPLRLIQKSSGLSIAIQTIINIFPNIFNIFLVSLIFYTIFGVFCVTFKRGALYSCLNNLSNLEIDTNIDCLNAGGEWVN